jgi:hypothetical protein
MCADNANLTYEGMLSDPLIRLMMDSDGVTHEQLVTVLREAAQAVAARAELLPMKPPPVRLLLVHSRPLEPAARPARAPVAARHWVRPTGT